MAVVSINNARYLLVSHCFLLAFASRTLIVRKLKGLEDIICELAVLRVLASL